MPQEYQTARRPIKGAGLHYTGFGPKNRDGSAGSRFCTAVFRISAKVGLAGYANPLPQGKSKTEHAATTVGKSMRSEARASTGAPISPDPSVDDRDSGLSGSPPRDPRTVPYCEPGLLRSRHLRIHLACRNGAEKAHKPSHHSISNPLWSPSHPTPTELLSRYAIAVWSCLPVPPECLRLILRHPPTGHSSTS